MGCCLPGSQDGWPLAEGGANAPYKLSRTAGSVPCVQVLHQGQESETYPCLVEDGQHIGDSLYQHDGRDGVPSIEQVEQGLLAVVHGEGHLCTSTTSGREAERYSRRGILGDEGQVRLDALPKSLSDHQSQTGSPRSGPVCIDIINPTTGLCELETRSGGNGHGCIHSRLVGPEGLCQPTLEHYRQGAGSSSTTK